MSRIVHFEFGTDNPAAASAFYEEVFGWQFQTWDGPQEYWLVTTGPEDQPGINGGLMRSQDGQPRTINIIQVDDVDAFTEKVIAKGGEIVMPKMAIHGVGYSAYFKDPGGLLVGLYQPDPTAQAPSEDKTPAETATL